MLPTLGDVHVDAPLTDFALTWDQDDSNYIADKAFASLGVEKASDKYFTYNREDFLRDQTDLDLLLAPGSPVRRAGYRMSTGSYSTDVRAIAKAVPREIAANADTPVSPEMDAVKFVIAQLKTRREAQWMTKFFATSIWGTDLTPANLWSDFTLSDPLTDVKTTARLAVQSATGFVPNTFVVGPRVDAQLKLHPLVKDQYKYTTSESISEDMLARLFEVERYMVAKAVNATSKEGNATVTLDFIAGKHALLAYHGTSNTQGPTAGRIFNWNGYGNNAGIAIQSYWEDQTRSTIVEGFMAWDMKVVSGALGYFFNGAVA